MVSVLVIAALAASVAPGGSITGPDPAALDARCYRLMEHLADSEEPRVRALALPAAQFFLGRLDARGMGVASPLAEEAEGDFTPLLRTCGDIMEAGGIDLQDNDIAPAPHLPAI